MRWKKKLKEFICFFDTYATSIKVQFKYKSTFQTNFGGFISTLLILLGLAALIFLYIYLENRDEQKIVTFRQRYNDPPQIILSTNSGNITYEREHSNLGFFFFSIYFLNTVTNKSMTLEDVNTQVIFLSNITTKDTGSISNQIVKCNELYPDIINELNNVRLNDSYCIKNVSLTIQGDYISDIYQYVLLRIAENAQATDHDILQKMKVLIYRSDYAINNTIKYGSPIRYSVKPIEIQLSQDITYEADIYLSFNEFHSNDNIYAPWGRKKIQNCLKIDKMITRYLPNLKQRYMSIYFRSSYQYEHYQRNYKTFFDLLWQIGGLWKVFIFIGAIIIVPINLNLMNVAISNKMFNMVHPHNEEDVQMTYDQYVSKEEEYNQIPSIFKALNPVLKRMSFEYYRYERNKGLDFTLEEALGKMFCCCCKIKTLQGKDMIFQSSKQEIEARLDTVAVARFAQEVKAMRKVFLENYLGLLKYNSTNNIDYSLLDRIRLQTNEQSAFAKAKPMSIVYHKQNHLVNAFNILRNQGDLAKIDLLIIQQFNLDPELVLKFFITYYDRFEYIYPDLFRNQRQQRNREMKDQDDYTENIISINKKRKSITKDI